MPPRPKLHEVVMAFAAAEDVTFPGVPNPLTPQRDILKIDDQDLFVYYRIDDALPPHWAPFPYPEYRNNSTLKRALFDYTVRNQPDFATSPSSVRDMGLLLENLLPASVPSLSTATTIAFQDQSFDFISTSFVPNKKEHLTSLAFPFRSTHLAAPTPFFDAFIAAAFPEDPEGFSTFIYEMIGYLVTPPALIHTPAVFYLYGDTGCGKSVLLDVIEAMFPDYLKSALSLQALTTDKFMLADLAGKLVNIVDEDESEYINGGRLKALTSFRPMQAQRKYGQSFRFTPYAKQFYVGNAIPALKSVDSAIKRRMKLVQFKHRIPQDKVDIHLTEKLLKELPGILGKAISHATNFLKREQIFTIPPLMDETLEEFMLTTSSALGFFEERYTVTDESERMPSNQIYTEYVMWCEEQGRKRFSNSKFFAALDDVPGLKSFRGGKGVRLRNCRRNVNIEGANAEYGRQMEKVW